MELEIKNLTKIYNKQTVLTIEELSINIGELIGLIGNNGAGKTTLLRLLIDLIKADSGTVYSRNKKVNKTEDWKFYTSAYIDTGFLIEFFTPEEYFQFIASNYKIDNDEVKNTLNQFEDFMHGEILGKQKYIRDFSTGNQQKIGIIGAIISKPEILLLDEPFNFLDPSSQYFISNYLNELNKQYHTTIISSSHNLECIFNISSRILLLDKGHIIKDISPVNNDSRDTLANFFKLNG
ncbi:MAG: SkfA peptide export ATP-binding protein SkfE [Candidatus Ordinivivax streblomastigis]|jgi:ABC-2 type transport system ATP-binding protein|uniref:SkfA peptide export ATP-binding protein SkfE n=1 Tax=Candidatus Ordinivivax streblomastigis TaxID=2540710 RepID=A0A5M8P4U6_9BACT|nr:MAG: SkfA peptide export ATP-binding protein SkfE [Candidatus Ordinivivax streblomastigis]